MPELRPLFAPPLPTTSHTAAPREDEAGTRAIEIATMVGDSVVAVRHLGDPCGGRVRRRTWVAVGTGVAFLAAAALAFALAVGIAADNRRARAAVLADTDRAPSSFRPTPVPLAYDAVAFGGAALGIAALAWGLWRRRAERTAPLFRLGSAPGVELAVADAPAPAFPLVAPRGDAFWLSFTPAMSGEVVLADGAAAEPLAALIAHGRAAPSPSLPGAFELRLDATIRARLRAGRSTVLVSSVPAPRRAATAVLTVEGRVLAFFAASAAVHLVAIVLLATIPPDPRSLSLDLGSLEQRLTRVDAKAVEDARALAPAPGDTGANDGAADATTGMAMAGAAGKAGTKEAANPDGRFAVKDNGLPPQLAHDQAVAQAREAGFLGELRRLDAFATLTGAGDQSSGLDDANIYGGFQGDEPGAAAGGFGFAPNGFGPGGGGTGWDTYGAGDYGRINNGTGGGGTCAMVSCEGDHAGFGRNHGVMGGTGRGHAPQGPTVRIDKVQVGADYSKDLIRRYIRRKLPQITYCYEKQLLVEQRLAGTVTAAFQISPTGAVLGARASGMSDTVGACVADIIAAIQFPKPPGGLLVNVRSYGFEFRPTGT